MIQRTGRALFVLNEPGYFRLYGSTILELERRGWEVALVFDRPHRRGDGAEVPAGAGARVRSLGALRGEVASHAATLRVVLDYLRYLEPSFARTAYLRHRIERLLPRAFRILTRVSSVPPWFVPTAIRIARLAERFIAVDPTMREFIRAIAPDVIVISPVVIVGGSGSRQTEATKAGRMLGIPVVVGVASWDHLTSKGLIRVVPDAVTVWNETQAREAEALHRIPRSRIIVTGAQSLDHWFEPIDPLAAQNWRRTMGIDDERKVVLFVGSSRKMAPADSEVHFVRRWLAELRRSGNPSLSRAFVLVRPHPSNTDQWQDVEVGPDAAVFPRRYSGMPLSADEVDAFRYSLFASSVVVGVNTTAMIEAAILRKPVFSVRDAGFDHSQRQTLHFGYLMKDAGGCVSVADSLADHVAQLEASLAGNVDYAALDEFVQRFVRPLGRTIPATSLLCDAIERVAARQGPAREGTPARTERVVVARER